MKISIGSWITLGHLSIVEIMADAGFDWLCVDLEHSVIDYLQAEMTEQFPVPIGSIIQYGEDN